MSRRHRTTWSLGVVAAVVLAVVLAGCGRSAEVQTSSGDVSGHGSSIAPSGPDPTASAPTSDEPGPPGPGEPSLPPGDPGLDAPAVPDPGTASAGSHPHGEARRSVPVRAMLTAADLRMTLGGRWERHAGGGEECVVPDAAAGTRTMTYGGTSAGTVVETVAIYPDADESDAAVLALREAVEACGWQNAHDPRLGSAAVAADDGPRVMTAVSTEGVLVVLVGTGKVADGWTWDALIDLASGSACPAAPDGCH
jgi:hypothetical protein